MGSQVRNGGRRAFRHSDVAIWLSWKLTTAIEVAAMTRRMTDG